MMNFRRRMLTCGFALTVAGLPLAYWGCNSHSAPVANEKRAQSPPPVVHTPRIDPAATPILALADEPQAQRPWQGAAWATLATPLDSARMPPATRVATVYDENTLYVAFVCSGPATPPAGTTQDNAEVWLDTSARQDGTELLCIVTAADGKAAASWYRYAQPPKPKADGSPDPTSPGQKYPVKIADLQIKTGRTTLDGQAAWTAVFTIPLRALPASLMVEPRNVKEGTRWKINCIRSQAVEVDTEHTEILQAHLSPVYQGCQQLSPYRMAPLVLEGPKSVALQAGP